jgi:hypothetical protein
MRRPQSASAAAIASWEQGFYELNFTHSNGGRLTRHKAGFDGLWSALAMGLPYLDQAMRAWGRSQGIEITIMDADLVSETNCVRQPFSVSDIGINKATVLINRINLFWGTQWKALPFLIMDHQHSCLCVVVLAP